MLWVSQNPWHFTARAPLLSMTGQFVEFKTEIVARLADRLIPFVPQAGAAETRIQDTVQISLDLLIDAAENRGSMFILFIATQVTKHEFDEFIAKRMRDELLEPEESSKSANQGSRWIFVEKR